VKNPGGFQVRVEPNATDKDARAYYIQLSEEPTELPNDVAQNILNIYGGKVEEVLADTVEEQVEQKATPFTGKLAKLFRS
jgi:hypothetical protein